MSQHLYRTLLHKQGSPSAKILATRKSKLFLDNGATQSCVQAYRVGSSLEHLASQRTDSTATRSDTGERAQGPADVSAGREHDLAYERPPSTNPELPIVELKKPEDVERFGTAEDKLQTYFILQQHSRSRLSIAFNLFESLMSAKSVPAQFHDYILYMGEKTYEIEVLPPPMRYRIASLHSTAPSNSLHQGMYSLRFVEQTGRGDPAQPTTDWSLRQTAVYCDFDTQFSKMSWVLVTPSQPARRRLTEYLLACESNSQTSPFDIHLLLLDTAISTWRAYVVDLGFETEGYAARLLGASPDGQGPVTMGDYIERQSLMILDDKMLNAEKVIKSTEDTIQNLLEFYKRSTLSARKQPSAEEDMIHFIFNEQLHELENALLRLAILRSRLQTITDLVSSFLDLSSGFTLQNLAVEAGKETSELHELTKKTAQDAVVVKVLTILTLIYLPMTVVSNFLSTAFVSKVTPANGSSYLSISGDWWIFVASSVPLTLITLYTWYVWKEIQAKGNFPCWWPPSWRHSDWSPTSSEQSPSGGDKV
jgi:Mg2+ and Co2+ transporter CorA